MGHGDRQLIVTCQFHAATSRYGEATGKWYELHTSVPVRNGRHGSVLLHAPRVSVVAPPASPRLAVPIAAPSS